MEVQRTWSVAFLLAWLLAVIRQASTSHSAKIELEQYLEWLKDGGANFTKVALTEIQNGKPTFAIGACKVETPDCYRGVVALDKIKEGALIITIPLSLSAYDSDAERRLPFPYKDAPPDVRLAAWLAAEKSSGPESDIYPMLTVLPETLTLPLFFTDKEVEELQFPSTVKAAKRQCEMVKEHFELIQAGAVVNASLAHLKETTLEAYRWVSGILSSRMLTQSFSDGEGVFLVPFVDMINHNQTSNVEWVLRGSQVAEVVATRGIAKGEELFDYYSRKTWDEWIVQYGFTPVPNRDDYVIIFESVQGAIDWYIRNYGIGKTEQGRNKSPNASEREAVSGLGVEALVTYFDAINDSSGFNEDTFRFLANRNDELLVLFATLWRNGTSEHVCHSEGKYEGLCLLEGPDVEHAAGAIIKRMEELIGALPTSLEQDQALLKDSKQSANLQAILRYRVAKKEALHDFVKGLQDGYKLGDEQIRVPVKSIALPSEGNGTVVMGARAVVKSSNATATSAKKNRCSVGKDEL